jgi:hypothetical protein
VAKAAWSPLNGQNHQNGTKKGPKEGQKGPRPIEKIPKNAIFQNPIQNNSFSENFTCVEAVRKSPPGGIIYFWTAISPNGALCARPIKRRKGKCYFELVRLIVLFRVGLEQLFVVFRLSGFPVGLPQFFVRAVVTGDYFVGLVRLNLLFVSRWACATFVSEFRFRCIPSVGLSQFFCLGGMEENSLLSSGR